MDRTYHNLCDHDASKKISPEEEKILNKKALKIRQTDSVNFTIRFINWFFGWMLKPALVCFDKTISRAFLPDDSDEDEPMGQNR